MFKTLKIIPKDIIAFLAISLVLILAFYIYFFSSVKEYQETVSIQATYTEIINIEDHIFDLLRDEETGQRGFTLTHRTNYLYPYYAAKTELPTSIKQLELLLKNSTIYKVKKIDLNYFKNVVYAKEAEMQETIKMVREGHQENAMKLIMSDKGRRYMRELTTILNSSKLGLEKELSVRHKRISDKFNKIVESLFWGGVIVLILLSGVIYKLWHEILNRRRYESDLFELNHSLEELIALRTNELELEKEALHNNQELLREQYDFTKSITDGMQEGVYCIDTEKNINFINNAGARILGYTVDELIGENAHKTIHYLKADGSEYELTECPLIQVVRAGRIITNFEDVFTHKNGALIPVVYSSSPLVRNGKIIGGVVSFQDITLIKNVQKDADDARKESEEQFKVLANSIPQLAWMADATGNITWYNKRWYDYTGTTFEEMKGWGWQKVHHPDEVDRVVQKIKHSFETGEIWEDTFPLRSKDGYYRWFLSRAIPLQDNLGKIRLWFGTNTDITEFKEMQNALSESELKFRTLTEAMPQIVWTASAQGELTYINKRWYDYSGSTAESSLNAGWVKYVHPEDKEKTLEAWSHSLETGESYTTEFRLQDKFGTYRWYLARGICIRDNDNNAILNWFGTCTDIQDLMDAREIVARSQEDLEKLVEMRTTELQAVNNELESFSYSISHDLRSPLRSIAGFSQALVRNKKEMLDTEAQDFLNRILTNTTRMGQLIDDILRLSRLTRGEMKLEHVNLSEIAGEITKTLQEQNPKRKVTLLIEPNIYAEADLALMHVVLQNLLENAWKFTSLKPKSTIEFNKQYDEEGRAIYYVRDNGDGFDMKYANKLFGVFQRLHAMEEFPGTGIGLATVKRIIHRHNGQIWAESAKNEGTTFYFTL